MESHCPLDGPTLSRFLDNELPPVEARVVEIHLADCASCDERLSQFRLADRLLARVRADRRKGTRAASLATAAALLASVAANVLMAPAAPSPTESLAPSSAPSINLSSFYETVAPPAAPAASNQRWPEGR